MAFFHQLLRVGRTDESIIHAQAEHFYDFVQHTSQQIMDEAQHLESSIQARGPNHIITNVPSSVRSFGRDIAINRMGQHLNEIPAQTLAQVNRITASIPHYVPIPFQDRGVTDRIKRT